MILIGIRAYRFCQFVVDPFVLENAIDNGREADGDLPCGCKTVQLVSKGIAIVKG
jgi:hypothetical protein